MSAFFGLFFSQALRNRFTGPLPFRLPPTRPLFLFSLQDVRRSSLFRFL